MTNTRIFYLLLILWSTFIIREYLFLFVLKKNTVAFILTLTIALAMIALVYMHGRIFLTVYQRRRIEASVHHHHGRAIARGVRDARSCIIVLFCTVCCYLPVSVEIGLRERTLVTSIVLNPWSSTLLFSASILNSIIFYWQNKILRNQSKAILRAFCSF